MTRVFLPRPLTNRSLPFLIRRKVKSVALPRTSLTDGELMEDRRNERTGPIDFVFALRFAAKFSGQTELLQNFALADERHATVELQNRFSAEKKTKFETIRPSALLPVRREKMFDRRAVRRVQREER